jgi:2-oxoglutarate ferredoxin oxidoreductase subunit beta
VARSIDTDAQHLQETLRRAHAHRGTAFVEILQNCPVFNDGIWKDVEDRKSRVDNTQHLEHGEPHTIGVPGRRKGIVMKGGVASVIELGDEDDAVERGVVVHDQSHESPAYASVLATLKLPDFPLPTGVFRQAEKACYEDMLTAQVDEAIERKGKGDLHDLLHSGDTWTVEV